MIAKLSDTNGPEAAKIAAMIAKLADLQGPVAKLEAIDAIYAMIVKLPDLHASEATKIASFFATLPELHGSPEATKIAEMAKVPELPGPELAKVAALYAIAAIEKLHVHSPEATKIAAMAARRPGFRGPRDPAFDPKNELLDLLWLAFSGGDEEEARFMRSSEMLAAFFEGLGFSFEVASFISTAVVKDFVDLLPKKKGRPWSPYHQRLLKAQEQRLKEIKQDLRARGEKGSVQKKAMQQLQKEHEQMLRSMAPDVRRYATPFDYDQIETYMRRSKKRSNK